MKKINFYFGNRTWSKEFIYITPTIYSLLLNSKFEPFHSLQIEFQFLFIGIGMKIKWRNKKIISFNN
jgi:hypothetical protein